MPPKSFKKEIVKVIVFELKSEIIVRHFIAVSFSKIKNTII